MLVGYKLITSDNMIGFGHELKRKGVEYVNYVLVGCPLYGLQI